MLADREPGLNAPPEEQTTTPSSVADGQRRSLAPESVNVERLARWIVTGIVSLGLALLMLIRGLSNGFGLSMAAEWLAVVALLIWWAHFWPAIAYRHASYVVSADGIEIRRGVVWRTIIDVPRSRVQHTDVSQGPIERTQDLGALAIYTAGTDYARVRLPGLRHSTAMAIRDHLLPGISDDAV